MPNLPIAMTESLSVRLRLGTKKAHRAVEKVQFVRSFLKGFLHRDSYLQYLCDLQLVYSVLEQELCFHASNPKLSPVFHPQLFRSGALLRDLAHLAGPHWQRSIQPSGVARDYARRLSRLSRTTPHLLAAHAYTRYLGDLSGGQVLCKMAQVCLRIAGPEGLAFYQFPLVSDVAAMRTAYRQGLDELPLSEEESASMVAEAISAFEWNQAILTRLSAPAPARMPPLQFPSATTQRAG